MRTRLVIQLRNKEENYDSAFDNIISKLSKPLRFNYDKNENNKSCKFPSSEDIAVEIFEKSGFKMDCESNWNNVPTVDDKDLKDILDSIPERNPKIDIGRDVIFFGYTKIDRIPFLAIRDSEGTFSIRLADKSLKKLTTSTHQLIDCIKNSENYKRMGMSIVENTIHVLEHSNKTELATGVVRKNILSDLWIHAKIQIIVASLLIIIASFLLFLRVFIFNIDNVHKMIFDLIDKVYSPLMVASITSLINLIATAVDRKKDAIHWQLEKT